MTLPEAPSSLVSTRDALHQLAFYAIAPARYKAMGRMGLRPIPNGFGTPVFDGRMAAVRDDFLVYEENGAVATRTIGTIREAAEFFGVPYEQEWFSDFYDPLPPADPDQPLDVDVGAVRFLAEWFEFGFEVLDQLSRRGSRGDDVSEAQLWPEHFDAAIEMGAHDKGQRASFGASPGDADHPQPYLYVAAWSDIDRAHTFWNDTSFNGASLGYADLRAADEPQTRSLEFLLEGYRVLHSA